MMTRIFTDGAEMRDLLFWTSTVGGIAVGSATPFASPYYYSVGASDYVYKSFSAISELYLRQRIYTQDFNQSTTRYPSFRNDSTTLVYLASDANYHLCAYATTIGLLEDSGIQMLLGQWYLFEVYLKIGNDPDGRCVVYLDGVKVIDYTGDTQPASVTTINNVYWGAGDSNIFYIDDIALNDTDNSDGRNDNSWCGPGVVIKITPDGNGTTNDWTGLDGDKINNYLQVDEYPYDSETSYVYAAAGSAVQDQYAMSDYTGTNRTILRVWTEARARKTDVDGTIKLGILPSGGTDDMSDEINLSLAYGRVIGNDYKTNPLDSGAWEEADLDAIEAVIEVNSSSSSTSSSSSSSSTTSSSSSTEIP